MKNNTGLRWVLTILAVIINALGVAFITRAALGTVPATSIPAVLAIVYDRFTIGGYLFVMSIIQILIQIVLLKKEFHMFQLLQIVPSLVLSYFVDFFMGFLKDLPVSQYPLQLLWLLVGTVILSFSIALEVKVDLIYLPLDGMNKAIAEKTGKSFDLIKTITDCTMVVIALVIILAVKHGLYGIREGTIISALIAGYIVKLFAKLFDRMG